MGRQPTRFGPSDEDRQRWRAYIRGGQIPAMASVLSTFLKEQVLPCFHFRTEPEADLVQLSRQLAAPLLEAVLTKLACQRGLPAVGRLEALIRAGIDRTVEANADRAFDLVGQACAWAEERLLEDLKAHPHPRAGLAGRIRRVVVAAPIILPSRRGARSAWLGPGYELSLLAQHDRVVAVLRTRFPGHQWGKTKPGARLPLLRSLRVELDLDADTLHDKALSSAAQCLYRSEAVLVLTAYIVSFEPKYLEKVIRRVRPLADRRPPAG